MGLRTGEADLVRRHHTDAGSQPLRITLRDFGARGAIDDHRRAGDRGQARGGRIERQEVDAATVEP
ncbi:MAG: hypothetical protein MUE46_19630, partial [Xanthomonadales bacterium]|nr:hypothetical protein [Xanthomonadales bacterium]